MLERDKNIKILFRVCISLWMFLPNYTMLAQEKQSGTVTFQAAQITLVSGAKKNIRNAVIQDDSLLFKTFWIEHAYHFINIEQLRYSNKNHAENGVSLGAVIGFGVPLAFAIKSHLSGDGPEDGVIAGPMFFSVLITTPLCMLAGYIIGRQFYTDWKEFDLTPYRKEKLSFGLKPMRGGLGIGLRIPLRR